MMNELGAEIREIAARANEAIKAAETGNTGAMEEALAEAGHRISELLRDVEIDGRGNQTTRIQNTDV